MPRGGARPNSGPDPSWQHGRTTTVRIPRNLKSRFLSLAREIDVSPDAIDIALEHLQHSLTIRANTGGAIKTQVREAIRILQPLCAPPSDSLSFPDTSPAPPLKREGD